MHVGIFTESYPPIVNGVSTSVQTLIAELERAGHRASVFTSRVPRHRDTRPGVYRYPSVNAVVEPDYVVPVPVSPSIERAISTLGLDIVHSQSPFLLGLVAARTARRLRVPHLSTNHTLYTEYAHYVPFLPRALTRQMLTRWQGWFYNACDHVLAPSEFTKVRLLEMYGVRSPVSVVPTGIPAPPFVLKKPADVKRELGLPEATRLLLYVGRLAPEKNLPTLLRAFQTILAARPDTALVLAGSGKSEAALRRLTRELEISRRTLFTGFLERTRLHPLYRAADLFVFPSRTETQGLAIGEALAAGTPAVVVRGGGAPEAIQDGENGVLVGDSADELAAQTLRLLEDDARRHKMADAARARAQLQTPEQVAGRIIGIYEGLLASRQETVSGGGAGTRPEYEVPRGT